MKVTSMLLGALVAGVLMAAPAAAQDEPAKAPAAAPAAKAAPAVVYVPVGCCSYSKSLNHFWEGRHPADHACWHGCHGHSHAHTSCYSSCYSHCGGHGHGCCGGGSLFYFHLF